MVSKIRKGKEKAFLRENVACRSKEFDLTVPPVTNGSE
jgi:hypothetical protein